MGRGGGGCGGGCGGGGWHWAGAFNHKLAKLGARFRRGHSVWAGPTGSVGWTGVQGRAEVGPTSGWATQEGHVDPVHGQRRKVGQK